MKIDVCMSRWQNEPLECVNLHPGARARRAYWVSEREQCAEPSRVSATSPWAAASLWWRIRAAAASSDKVAPHPPSRGGAERGERVWKEPERRSSSALFRWGLVRRDLRGARACALCAHGGLLLSPAASARVRGGERVAHASSVGRRCSARALLGREESRARARPGAQPAVAGAAHHLAFRSGGRTGVGRDPNPMGHATGAGAPRALRRRASFRRECVRGL